MIGRALAECWHAGEAILVTDLAAHGVPKNAADLVRRDPLVAAGRRAGTIGQDVDSWLIAVRADPVDDQPADITASDPATALRTGAVVDVVTFDPGRPMTWTLRANIAKVLGRVEAQVLPPLPGVRIHRTPMDWLRAGGDGIAFVFLDRTERARRARLRDDERAHYSVCDAIDIRTVMGQLTPSTPILVSDAKFGARLREILEMPLYRHPIFVERARDGATVAA